MSRAGEIACDSSFDLGGFIYECELRAGHDDLHEMTTSKWEFRWA